MKSLILVGLVTTAAALGSVSASAHVPHRCQHIDGPVKKQVCINKWYKNHDVVVVRDRHHHHHNHLARVGAKLVVRVPIRF